MISNLEIKKLPYVDDVPEDDQKRIQWVRNNDCLEGASTKYGHDGILNASGVAIQTNVERLLENEEAAKDKVNEVISSLNNINEALDMSTNTDFVKQVNKNTSNIETLQVHVQFAEDNIGELETQSEFLKEDIGVYDPVADSYYRTVRNNLVWLKKELGQYQDQDINGQPKQGNSPTGMKRRIMDNTSGIVAHSIRIKTLEDNYQDSEVGSVNIRVNEIREELGPKSSSTGTPIYTRLVNSEEGIKANILEINNIKTAIGYTHPQSINQRVTDQNVRLGRLEDDINLPTTGLKKRVTDIEKDLGSDTDPKTVKGRVKANSEEIKSIEFLVGTDSSSGLRGEVAWMAAEIGDPVAPEARSLNGRVAALQKTVNINSSAIQDLQAEIGTNKTGLKGQVLTLHSQMNGTNPNGITVAERGVIPAVTALETKQTSYIQEAPQDGEAYVRVNKAWVKLSTFLTP